MTFVTLTLAAICSVSVNILFAHPGGHYHSGDKLNSWTLADGQTVSVNFSKGNGDQLVLEQLGGKLVTISVQSMSAQDPLLARFKMEKFERLNK